MARKLRVQCLFSGRYKALIVERGGNVWVFNLPLHGGTNTFTLMAVMPEPM